MSIEQTIRELGERIYREQVELAALPIIEGTPIAARRDRLALAGKWNALALQGCK